MIHSWLGRKSPAGADSVKALRAAASRWRSCASEAEAKSLLRLTCRAPLRGSNIGKSILILAKTRNPIFFNMFLDILDSGTYPIGFVSSFHAEWRRYYSNFLILLIFWKSVILARWGTTFLSSRCRADFGPLINEY